MIPKNQVLVVTGEARSGTSAMMESLRLAGIDVCGDKWPNIERINRAIEESQNYIDKLEGLEKLKVKEQIDYLIQRKKKISDNARNMNDKGFWEEPGIVVRGLQELGDRGGKAIKIISSGIPQRTLPNRIGGTTPSLIWKMIVCLREPQFVAESQRNLDAGIEIATGQDWKKSKARINLNRFIIFNGRFAAWLLNCDIPYIVVNYDDIVENPKTELTKIFNFLEYQPTTQQFDDSVNNYNTGLRRSNNNFTGWPDDLILDAQDANCIYNSIKNGTKESLLEVKLILQNYIEKKKLETVRWYEPMVGWMVVPYLVRQIYNDESVVNKLRSNAIGQMRAGLHPQFSDDYIVLSDTYIIKRPIDLGDLTCNYVEYCGTKMTREDAFLLHQNNYVRKNRLPINNVKLSAWNWSW